MAEAVQAQAGIASENAFEEDDATGFEPGSAATDRVLIRRIAAREEQAMVALYDAHVQRIFHVALRVLRHAEMAEEVVVDTFWQAWQQAHRFDAAKGTPCSWLITIARTRALDKLRRTKKHHPVQTGDDLDAHVDPSTTTPDAPASPWEGRRLNEAIGQLDAQSRQLVTLAYFHGLSHSEIAQRQLVPLGTVKSVLRRAVARLRTDLVAPVAAGAS